VAVRFPSLLLSALLIGSTSASIRATESFTKTLPATVQAEFGVNRLSTEQRATLDGLIERDIEAARQGDVVAFARGFCDRRTPEEQNRAGLTLLTAAERSRLDNVVATAIASRPISAPTSFAWSPTSARILRERERPIVHGQVSVFVGGSSGGHSWYGGSFETSVTDPQHRLTLTVGMTEVREKGARDGCGVRRW
jgi:hypothetical protein